MKNLTPRWMVFWMLFLASLPMSSCNPENKAGKSLAAARRYITRNNDPAAAIELRKLLQHSPGHPQALKELGMIRARQGAWHEAARLLCTARPKLPDDPSVTLALATTWLEMGFIGDCRQALIHLLNQSPSTAEALIPLAQCATTKEEVDDCAKRCHLAEAAAQPEAAIALAILDFRQGNTANARRTIDQVLTSHPDHSTALLWKARAAASQDHPADALPILKRAADLAGPRSRESLAYAALLIETQQFSEAANLLNQTLKSAPDYLPPRCLLARIALAKGQQPQAVEHLSKTLAASPLDLNAGLMLSQIHLQANQTDAAGQLLRQLDRAYPGRPIIALLRAKTCLAAKQSQAAAEILDPLVHDPASVPEASLMRAQIHLENQQPAEAIRLLAPLKTAQPGLAEVRPLLLRAYLQTPRLADALELLGEEAASRPQDPEPLLQSARILHTQGQHEKARAAIQQALTLAPDHPAAITLLAAIDLQQNQPGNALDQANQYLARHPDSPEATLLKASVCYMLDHLADAEEMARRTLALNPSSSTACAILARIQTRQGRSQEALLTLQKLVSSEPTNIGAQMHLACLLQELNQINEAHAAFVKILELSPDFAPAYNNLAVIQSEYLHQADQALASARKARSLAPGDPSIADTLGWIEYKRARFRPALTLLLEAANGLPHSPTVLYHLGMAHSMMNQNQEAIAALESAIRPPLPFPERDSATARLKLLRELPILEITTLEPILENSPGDVPVLMRKAACHTTLGESQTALATLEQALKANPELDLAHLAIADLCLGPLQQPARALDAASQARTLNPLNSQATATLAWAHFLLGNHDQALALSTEAFQTLQNDPLARFHHALITYHAGLVPEARDIMTPVSQSDSSLAGDARNFLLITAPATPTPQDTAALIASELNRNPRSVPALMAQANLGLTQGKNPASTYRTILSLAPAFTPARIALARLLIKEPDQLDEAETLARDARKRNGENPELHALLGIVAFHRGDFQYATQLLASASLARPLDPEEQFTLGMSQAATGSATEARDNLIHALNAGLATADAETARKTIDNLTKPQP